MLAKEGAVALNHHDTSFADKVSAATDGRGPDVILEMLANVNLAKDLGLVAKRGRIIVIGNRGTIEINPRDAMAKGASIIGMMLLNTTADETQRIAAAVGDREQGLGAARVELLRDRLDNRLAEDLTNPDPRAAVEAHARLSLAHDLPPLSPELLARAEALDQAPLPGVVRVG